MNSECSICFEIIRSSGTKKPLVTLCGHLFHDICIKSCLNNQDSGKCPQCNHPIQSSNLIRLYVNEPENSVRAKDDLIEQLKNQLRELNEKAQLQYDLIASLNRQIVLEKELSERGRTNDSSEPKASGSMLQRRVVAPAKLSLPIRLSLKKLSAKTQFKISDSSAIQPIAQGSAFGSSSPPSWHKGSFNNVFGNGKFGNSAAVGQNVFRFGSEANIPFNNSNQRSFEFPSIAANTADQNTNPFALKNVPTTKPPFSFHSSTDGLDSRSMIDSIISKRNPTVLRNASRDFFTGSNVCSAPSALKSSSPEAKVEPFYDWPSSGFSDANRMDDNVVQDASADDAACELMSNDVVVPEEEDS